MAGNSILAEETMIELDRMGQNPRDYLEPNKMHEREVLSSKTYIFISFLFLDF